jgi:hypothetical protein
VVIKVSLIDEIDLSTLSIYENEVESFTIEVYLYVFECYIEQNSDDHSAAYEQLYQNIVYINQWIEAVYLFQIDALSLFSVLSVCIFLVDIAE